MANNKTEIEVKREKAVPPGSAKSSPPRTSALGALRGEIDRLFDDFDWPNFRFPLQRRDSAIEPVRHWSDVWTSAPAMDLIERNGEYEVQAELPGLDLKDVEVKLSNGMLTIKGEKTEERTEEEENYHLRERSYGEFQRSFRLPIGIDAEKIRAKFENGVLKVNMPKTAEAKTKERKIEVKKAG